MKEAARNAGIHPTTLFAWIKQSMAGDPKMILTWLGHKAPWSMPLSRLQNSQDGTRTVSTEPRLDWGWILVPR
jgi:hypothetical protein